MNQARQAEEHPGRAVNAGSLHAMESRRFLDWAFGQYLEIAHPRFATKMAVA